MNEISKDVISILQYLLPGFITAWIYYSLTSYTKPSQFERTIQALIFTIFVQVFVIATQSLSMFLGNYFCLGTWSNSTDFIVSIISAIIFGFIISYLANSDKLHLIFRKLNITRETSYPSEWFGTFLNNVTYIVLHLKDERRLYGWPMEWPSDPAKGHFVLKDCSWLNGKKQIRLKTGDEILINVDDVKWVEFLEKTWENNDEQKTTKSSTSSKKIGHNSRGHK